jgi:hypothetical protein
VTNSTCEKRLVQQENGENRRKTAITSSVVVLAAPFHNCFQRCLTCTVSSFQIEKSKFHCAVIVTGVTVLVYW